MSSKRVSFSQKRRTDIDISDNELEDISPVKKQKKSDVRSRCRSIWQWISEIPMPAILREKMNKKLAINKPQAVIQLTEDEDEENDIDVINLEEDTPTKQTSKTDFLIRAAVLGALKPPSELVYSKPRYVLTDTGLELTHFGAPNPLFSSTPMSQTQSTLQRRPLKSWNDTWGQRSSTVCKDTPQNDIVIDDSDDSDDIEIIENVPSPSEKFSQNGLSKSTESKSCEGKGSDPSALNGKSSSGASGFSWKPNLYTACEVVKIQEKERYRMLLNQYSAAKTGHHIVSKQDYECSDDSSSEPEEVDRFFKTKPVRGVPELLLKYCKPCSRKTVPIVNLANDDDDDIFIEEEIKTVGSELPKYKPKQKSMFNTFSQEWIAEMKAVIDSDTQRMFENLAQEENKLKRYKDRRDAQLDKEKKMYELIWMKKEDEFPKLTPEMEAVIDHAFMGGGPREILASKDGIDLTRADIASLHAMSWLNDQVVNFYFTMLIDRSKSSDKYPYTYTFNTFFYTSLKKRFYKSVARWTRKVDIFSFDIVLVPLHLEVHWAFCIIDNRNKTIKYYDSMKDSELCCLEILQNYLVAEMKDKKKIDVNPNFYTRIVAQNIPQQMNGSDCGMFVIKYAEYLSREAPITFDQSHMMYFRRRTVYEIITGKLM